MTGLKFIIMASCGIFLSLATPSKQIANNVYNPDSFSKNEITRCAGNLSCCSRFAEKFCVTSQSGKLVQRWMCEDQALNACNSKN
ncbi:MAG: hypothetical protein SGJ02_07595 [bacterium]|nr:hypothetical protein [bacterium]